VGGSRGLPPHITPERPWNRTCRQPGPEMSIPSTSQRHELMRRVRKTFWICAFLVCFACLLARAQDVQFLPEIDAHLKLNSSVRGYLEAKNDRDGGDPKQLGIGPSMQIYLRPLIRLKDVTAFDLDDSKSRALVLETGYRYITPPGAPPENRMETIANVPFSAEGWVPDLRHEPRRSRPEKWRFHMAL